MTKILELISAKLPEEMNNAEMEAALSKCTGCGNEPKENETLCGIKLDKDHGFGFIVYPPEQLCPSCLEQRMIDYKNNFKPVA